MVDDFRLHLSIDFEQVVLAAHFKIETKNPKNLVSKGLLFKRMNVQYYLKKEIEVPLINFDEQPFILQLGILNI